MADITDPVGYHRGQLSARQVRAAELERSHLWLSRGRLATVLALLVLAAAAWQGWLSGWWLAVPAVLFTALAVVHDRVLRALRTATRAVDWHELALARLEDRWVGRGGAGERFRDPEHPYALDLDICGKGSLFQLLTTAQTAAGEESLARWLLEGADAATVRRRQAAVRDLAARPLFREDLYTAGADVRDACRFSPIGRLGDRTGTTAHGSAAAGCRRARGGGRRRDGRGRRGARFVGGAAGRRRIQRRRRDAVRPRGRAGPARRVRAVA